MLSEISEDAVRYIVRARSLANLESPDGLQDLKGLVNFSSLAEHTCMCASPH
jgi:hypothetical protein